MSDYYLPGFKAGGPIRTLANIVEYLGHEFSFQVITRDRDLGDLLPYPHLVNEAGHVGQARVSYLSHGELSFFRIKRRMVDVAPDVIYLNSFFSPLFTLIPLILRRLRQIPQIPAILAPRGEFAANALEIKSIKKRCYLFCTKLFRLCDTLIWQASGEHEAADIRREFPKAHIIVAPDLPPILQEVSLRKVTKKVSGRLRLVFLSRISRMKNLHGTLQILSAIRDGEIHFDIWGPIEDKQYWIDCEDIISKLPPNIVVHYRGEVSPDKVHEVFAGYDVFILSTLGENFGHVILEALGAGLPVIISDRTQWRNLAEIRAGWDLALNDIEQTRQIIKVCTEMDTDTLNVWSCGAKEFARRCCDHMMPVEKTRALFEIALGSQTGQ